MRISHSCGGAINANVGEASNLCLNVMLGGDIRDNKYTKFTSTYVCIFIITRTTRLIQNSQCDTRFGTQFPPSCLRLQYRVEDTGPVTKYPYVLRKYPKNIRLLYVVSHFDEIRLKNISIWALERKYLLKFGSFFQTLEITAHVTQWHCK